MQELSKGAWKKKNTTQHQLTPDPPSLSPCHPIKKNKPTGPPSAEDQYWKQGNVVKMTDEPLSDCSNSACAKKIGWLMVIFRSPPQIFWPSLAFCEAGRRRRRKRGGKKNKKTLSYLQLAGSSGRILEMTAQAPVLKPLKCSEGIQIKAGTGGEYVQFQLHVWASHYKRISPGPVWSTPRPSSPWKKRTKKQNAHT